MPIIAKDDLILINIYFGRVKYFDSYWKRLISASWLPSASGGHSVVSDSMGCNTQLPRCLTGFSLLLIA